MIKSRRISWGREESYTGYWWEDLWKRDHWGDPDVDGRIILRWIFRQWDVRLFTGLSWLRIETDCGRL
jgi:hypothetical protein